MNWWKVFTNFFRSSWFRTNSWPWAHSWLGGRCLCVFNHFSIFLFIGFLTIFCDFSLFLQNGWPLTQVDHDKNCHCLPQKRVSSKGDFSLIEQSNQIFWKKMTKISFLPVFTSVFSPELKELPMFCKNQLGYQRVAIDRQKYTRSRNCNFSKKLQKKIQNFGLNLEKKLKIF